MAPPFFCSKTESGWLLPSVTAVSGVYVEKIPTCRRWSPAMVPIQISPSLSSSNVRTSLLARPSRSVSVSIKLPDLRLSPCRPPLAIHKLWLRSTMMETKFVTPGFSTRWKRFPLNRKRWWPSPAYSSPKGSQYNICTFGSRYSAFTLPPSCKTCTLSPLAIHNLPSDVSAIALGETENVSGLTSRRIPFVCASFPPP